MVVTAVSLSGCFKLDMSLELSPDNTVDGSIILAVDKSQAELFGGEDALRESLSSEGSGLIDDAPDSGNVETREYEDDDWLGNEYVFEDVGLDEFSGADTGELSITREGDTFVVDGVLDLSQGTDGEPGAAALLASAETEISITFPGAVQSSNGVEDGNTVTWSPKAGESTEISAVGSAEAGLPVTVIIAVVALVALVAIGALLLVMLRRRQDAALPAAGPLPEGSIVPQAPAADAPLADAPLADAPPAEVPPSDDEPAPPAPPVP